MSETAEKPKGALSSIFDGPHGLLVLLVFGQGGFLTYGNLQFSGTNEKIADTIHEMDKRMEVGFANSAKDIEILKHDLEAVQEDVAGIKAKLD